MNMTKIMALWGLFHKGSEIANVEKWKQHQVSGTMIGAALVALIQVANAFGLNLPGVDSETATTIGAGIVAGFNIILTIITSKRAGFSVASEPVGASLPTPVEPEAPQQPVQAVNQPNVADITKYLADAHAALAADRGRRAEDSTYYGT
jgi:hypothetical protein